MSPLPCPSVAFTAAAGAVPGREQEGVVAVAVIEGGVERTGELDPIVLCVGSVGVEIDDDVAKFGCRRRT